MDNLWRSHSLALLQYSNRIKSSIDIASAREAFEALSISIEKMVTAFGTTGKIAVIKYHCPMAFNNKGANWLQDKDGTSNPYYGSMMLQCGEKVEEVK